MCENHKTTEVENLKGRISILESMIEKLNSYLGSGKSIHPNSLAHQELNKLRETCDNQRWGNWGAIIDN